MDFRFTPSQIAAEAVRRGVDPFWRGRIREMADWAMTVTGHPHGDRTVSPYTGLRVNKAWPTRGSITLYRQDGATVKLRLKGDKFVTETS